MNRFRGSILFIYGLILALLAFIYRDNLVLAIIAIPNLTVGSILGWKKFKIIVIFLLIGFIGLFINTYLVSNTGEIVFDTGFFIIREGVVDAFSSIALRLMTISGGTLIFLSLSDPYETVKTLENDLYLPKGISFSIYYALRLIPLIQRESREIQNIRVQRGYRKYLVTPNDFKTFLLPILSILLERAYWTGIAAELRGFQMRKTLHRKPILTIYDYIIIALLTIQVLLPYYIYYLFPLG